MSTLKTLSALSLLALVAACSTPQAPNAAQAAAGTGAVGAAQGANALAAPGRAMGVGSADGASASGLASASGAGTQAGDASRSGLGLPEGRSVYFDFDAFALKSDAVPLVEAHGSWLAANPQAVVKIEGNADERGGREYNLALGQKRAEAVVRALKTQGVKTEQVEAISWGKDKPRATGHDEAAWAENRRADFNYGSR